MLKCPCCKYILRIDKKKTIAEIKSVEITKKILERRDSNPPFRECSGQHIGGLNSTPRTFLFCFN